MHSCALRQYWDTMEIDIIGSLRNIDPITVFFEKSTDKAYKYTIIYLSDRGKVSFINFEKPNALDCRKSYAKCRHFMINNSCHQDWTISGLHTAGFWSMHLLHDYKHPTFDSAIKNIKENFNIHVIKLFPDS